MRIAVVGVGLIGGSIALAVRERHGWSVAGFDASDEALTRRRFAARRSIAPPTASPTRSLMPRRFSWPSRSARLRRRSAAALAAAPADCVVTDVGSTKRAVVAAHADPRFVGGHPLAGAENAGVEHARADLFEGATWYLTPSAATSGVLYERLHRLLRGLGAARPRSSRDARAILATVSHLPHVLANVLVSQAARALAAGGERLPATGPSFRDATRVAGAPSASGPTSMSPTVMR